MADLPKRVWSGKKQVYSGKKPVWVKDGKLGVYDPNFEEVTNGQYYSPNRWGNLSSDAELQIYDDKDSLNPTDIGTFEDGLSSTYQFVDWNGTVLKSGTVKDGETPVAPADPTREHYTFTGWNPTVGPINKNTTYSAVYAIDTFTVTFTVNNPSYGSVSPSSIANVPYGESIIYEQSVLSIGDTTVVATAESGYGFSSWGTLPETVTENLTITATFDTLPVITFASKIDCYDEPFFTMTPDTINAHIGDEISVAQNFTNITIGEQVVAVRGNVNDEVYFQTIDDTLTACFYGAIPTSWTQKLPTEGALPATVAGSATFFLDCPSSGPAGGIQVSPSALASSLTVDGRPSTSWTGSPSEILTINPVNVYIPGATTISLSNPTLSGGVAEALGADISSGNIELEIIVTSGTYTGNVEFDFVVDGFTMARVRLYLNVTVDGASY